MEAEALDFQSFTPPSACSTRRAAALRMPVTRLLSLRRDIGPSFLKILGSKIRVGQLEGRFKTPVAINELMAVDELGQFAETQPMSFCKSGDGLAKYAAFPSACVHQHRQEAFSVFPR